MFGGLGYGKKRSTATRVVTALSCTAAFMSVVTAEPGQKPLPGTRTAFELLASKSERDLKKLAPLLSPRRTSLRG